MFLTMMTGFLAGICGAAGRRVAGGLIEDLTHVKTGDQGIRLLFAATLGLAMLLASLAGGEHVQWWHLLVLIPLNWIGTTLGNLDSIGMGRSGHTWLRDFLFLTIVATAGCVLPAAAMWWLGYSAWYWVFLGGIFTGVVYEIGYRICPLVPGHGYSRPSWPTGFNCATALGECFYGFLKAIGMFLAVFLG